VNQVKSDVIAEVLLPLPFDHGFDYLVPVDHTLEIGDYVRVPFRQQTITGIVWRFVETSKTPKGKIKYITDKIPDLSLPQSERDFIAWMAGYTLTPIGSILKLTLPVPQAFETPKRALKTFDIATPKATHKVITFSPEQKVAVEKLKDHVKQKQFSTSLLDGITGSGKTEVYFEAVAQCLDQGLQALVLLPEISLTPQWLERFEDRFGCQPVVWNSQLTPAQRRNHFLAIAKGNAQVVVGARSALMLPYKNLGVIIVDEEHDSSYKQEEGVIYNARDMAVAKSKHLKCPIVLVSATPSLETFLNGKNGRYDVLHLPQRHGNAVIPGMTLVDMRQAHKELKTTQQWISPLLKEEIQKNLDNKEQTLLFLNRRGYAPLTLCRSCGHRLKCPNCSAWLVHHLESDKLSCHHCSYSKPFPKACPSCHEEKSLAACGPGVERIALEISQKFPLARISIFASDSFASTQEMADAIEAIDQQQVDIIIGTQMIAKGHHFPMLTLVGVLDADLGLEGGDLRACEKTYQLIHQVSGRCGRAEHPGRVILQTYNPQHPVIQALFMNDRQEFLDQESQNRQLSEMPPYGKLASIICSGFSKEGTYEFVRQLRRMAPEDSTIDIFGPAPAPLAIIRKRHRWRFLLKSTHPVALQSYIRKWMGNVNIPKNIKLQVDIDPISFL